MELRIFASYEEMKKAHQEDVNNFPMYWGFGPKTEEQLADELFTALGTRNVSDCVGNGFGGLILKSDRQRFNDMWDRHDRERELFNTSRDNFLQSIMSEMWNHEYAYTGDPEDTLHALGKTMDDLYTDLAFREIWKKAEAQVYSEYAESN